MSLILGLLSLALKLASLALLIYCVMSFIMPHHQFYRKAACYVEPLLHPVRMQLYRWFPSLRNMPLDFSPLALWLLIDVAGWVVNWLGRIF